MLLIGLAALVAATTATATTNGSVTVSTGKVKGLGTVLVDSKGRTLYMFVPDKQKRVTCTGSCAAAWPPLKVAKGEKIVAVKGARTALVGSDANPSGGRVVTYAKWPLYTYVGDQKAGQATGQALNLNGGLWYVLTPAGKIVKAKVSG
jgi:predicted lipoprotein with Yx(FWY)xxD motif